MSGDNKQHFDRMNKIQAAATMDYKTPLSIIQLVMERAEVARFILSGGKTDQEVELSEMLIQRYNTKIKEYLAL